MTANTRLYSVRVDLPVQADDERDALQRAGVVQELLRSLVTIANSPYYLDRDSDLDDTARMIADVLHAG